MRVTAIFLLAVAHGATAFTTTTAAGWTTMTRQQTFLLAAGATPATTEGFIATELRGAAMKLHTTQQAPKEGKVEVKDEAPKHVTTHADYLHFLVDSKFVYETLEEIVNEKEELAQFRNTGMERTKGLEQDIEFMMKEYDLERPAMGSFGTNYVKELRSLTSIPEFMCHYYNYYFAHTAGGRMIGKKMASMLLDKKTLEFYKVRCKYVVLARFSVLFSLIFLTHILSSLLLLCTTNQQQWDGDLNEIKATVKDDIEAMAAEWSREEKDECVSGTAAAFRYGGGINAYLGGAR
jgi:hypothetical protein